MKKVLYKPSLKAKSVWHNRNKAKIRFLEGAVRSSKSYTANDLAIHEIQELPACNILISGYSISSVARNVIAEWKSAIDPKNKGIFQMVREEDDHYLKINWRGLRDKKFYIRGAGKENDYMQIQGATFGYWLADELTRHCETFVDMALSRLSLDFSKAVWTTNPDHPLHYVKKRFIDDPEKYVIDSTTNKSEMIRFTFMLEDNPSLSSDYIKFLHTMYTGVFKQRFIYSQWVMAEGAIYDFFTEGVNTFNESIAALQKYIAIDYGTHNATCFLEFGRNDFNQGTGNPKVWAEREYYYDSIVSGRQKDNAEYAKDFVYFLGNSVVECVFYDPSAISLILSIKKELANIGKSIVFIPAVNDVLDGIKTQHRMLVSGEYKVKSTCIQTILDYGAYIWDVKKSDKTGVDCPVKINDHTKDTERYFLHTLFGGESIDYMTALR